MNDSYGYSIPRTNPGQIDQQISLQWKDLSVFVATQKQPKNKVGDPDLTKEPLLVKRWSSRTQFLNNTAQELSKNSRKFDYKCILDNQTGFARAGEVTAIMGPSGAGKTTMIAALSKRLAENRENIIHGDILANGTHYNSADFCNFGVFVMQTDLLLATFTVKECIQFSAALRLNLSEFERAQRVDQLIKDLKLTHCQHTYIGDNLLKGVSGGERKRASIAVELISDPYVLILDEPTSGLDSFTAYVLIDILRKIATFQKRTIVLTIHQPSSDIYQLLDKLILLKDGQTAYQGPTKMLVDYLRGLNLLVPKFSNPSDYFMNQLKATNSQLTYENYVKIMSNDVQRDQEQLVGGGFMKKDFINSFAYEFKVLSRRHITNYFRNPQLLQGRIFITIFMSAFPSILFWNVGNKHYPDPGSTYNVINAYVFNISGALFFIGTGQLFSTMGPLVQIFPIERQIFLKEYNSKQYRVASYFLSKLCIELPFCICTPILSATAIYYALGLRNNFDSYLEMVIVFTLITLCGNGLGIFGGSLFSDPKTAGAMVPLLILPLQVFGGQYSNLGTLGQWISWFQYISPFKYFQEADLRTQFQGVTYIAQGGLPFQPLQELSMSFGYWNCVLVLFILAISLHILASVTLKLLVRNIKV